MPNTDFVSRLIAYEDGDLDEDQTIALFQDLLDANMISRLQGHYGRTAQGLLNAGLIEVR